MSDHAHTERKLLTLENGGMRGMPNKFPLRSEDIVQYAKAAGIFAQRLPQRFINPGHGHDHPQRVIIGKATMPAGYMIESAISNGLAAVGVKNVLRLGPVPYGAVPWLTKSMRAVCGVMISAGQNDADGETSIRLYYDNGDRSREETDNELEQLVNSTLDKYLVRPSELGKIKQIEDARARYVEAVKQTLPRTTNLHGVRVILDCANGAAYRVGPELLEELGAKVFSIGIEPDGQNINTTGVAHPDIILKKMDMYRADFGIALDGDGKDVLLFNKKRACVDPVQIRPVVDLLKEEIPELAEDGLMIALRVMANMSREELVLC